MMTRIPFYVLLTISLIAYIILGYFTARTDFCQLTALFIILFTLYWLVLRHHISAGQLRIAIGAVVLFRLSMFFVVPNLSDDYFRFIWDGRLSVQGINPYSVLPRTLINTRETFNTGIDNTLFAGLNSPDYYTVYPPVAQFIFVTAAKLSPQSILGSIIVMRAFIILADIGTIYLIIRLLKEFHLPEKYTLFYAGNPLVITELSGNLHFEAILIFWLLLSVYLLIKSRLVLSAVCFALAVGTKLIPLIFLPLLMKRLGLLRSFIYYFITGITVAVLFIPFFDKQLIPHLLSSVNLYFQHFEFNSSVYRLSCLINHQMSEHNVIPYIGNVLSIVTLLSILIIAYREQDTGWPSLFETMLLTTAIYYLLATTVHPWYLTLAIMLSIYTHYRFIIIWSALLPLSYIAYQTLPYQKNFQASIVIFEYLTVIGFIIYEFLIRRKIKPLVLGNSA